MIPVGIFVFSSVILIVAVMIKISYVTKMSTGNYISKDIVFRYLRPLLFLMIMLFPFLFLFSYFYHYNPQLAAIESKYVTYITCNAVYNNATICGKLDFLPVFGWALLNDISPCVLGILSFITYGIQSRWITLWKEKLDYWAKLAESKGITGSTQGKSSKERSKDSSKTASIEMHKIRDSTKGSSTIGADSASTTQ